MRIFSIIVLILAILLFPVSALALVSQTAVPGDVTYPIKRKLEDGIVLLASVNPTTKAWFSTTRSDRRFQEATILITQGKSASNTLSELVVQTDEAAGDILEVKELDKKEELLDELLSSLEEYDQELEGLSAQLETESPVVEETEELSEEEENVKEPIRQTPNPTSTAMPVKIEPTFTPKPTLTPSPTPTPAASMDKEKIDETREELEKIGKRVGEERKKVRQGKSGKN